jgi:hypothetical protein
VSDKHPTESTLPGSEELDDGVWREVLVWFWKAAELNGGLPKVSECGRVNSVELSSLLPA